MKVESYYPHSLVVDVDLLTESPHSVDFLFDAKGRGMSFGEVSNHLGPVGIAAESREEAASWFKSGVGQEWIEEIQSCGNSPFFCFPEEYAQVIELKCGVLPGKTLFSKRAAFRQIGAEFGFRVFDDLDAFDVIDELLVEDVGVSGESGADSWGGVFGGLYDQQLDCKGSLGTSLCIHDYHFFTWNIDLPAAFKGQACPASRNMTSLVQALLKVSPISEVLVSFLNRFSFNLKAKYLDQWKEYENKGWISWDTEPKNLTVLDSNETEVENDTGKEQGIGESEKGLSECDVVCHLTQQGMSRLFSVVQSSFAREGILDVELFLMGVDPVRKSAGHKRAMFTEVIYGLVDPSWNLFHGFSGRVWDCQVSTCFRTLRSGKSKSEENWRHRTDDFRRVIESSGSIIVVGKGGKAYSSIEELRGIPVRSLEFIWKG